MNFFKKKQIVAWDKIKIQENSVVKNSIKQCQLCFMRELLW